MSVDVKQLKSRINWSLSACVNRNPDGNFCKDEKCQLCDAAFLVRRKLESDCRELLLALLAQLEQAEAPAKWAMPEEAADISATFNTLLEVSGRKPFSPVELKTVLPILTHVVTSELRRVEAALRTLRQASQRVMSHPNRLSGGEEFVDALSQLAAALAAEGGK